MPRVAFRMELLNGFEQEYKKRHDALWPELSQLLKNTGISDYSIYLDESTHSLFAQMTVEDEERLAQLPSHPVMQKWWKHMSDIMKTNPDHSPVVTPLKQVFYLP